MLRGSTVWDYHVSPDLNLSNRPVRTRMPGGVAGVRSMKTVPYADCAREGGLTAGPSLADVH
jgi:hypothetical protein